MQGGIKVIGEGMRIAFGDVSSILSAQNIPSTEINQCGLRIFNVLFSAVISGQSK